MISYRNQKESGFFDKYNVRLVPFAIQDADNNYKFKNSELIVRYMFASEQIESGASLIIIDKIFTDKDENDISYQTLFNEEYSTEEATKVLESWLKDYGMKETEIKEIRKITTYDEITTKMTENRQIVENEIKVKGIPTMIYDGKKHTGLFRASE